MYVISYQTNFSVQNHKVHMIFYNPLMHPNLSDSNLCQTVVEVHSHQICHNIFLKNSNFINYNLSFSTKLQYVAGIQIIHQNKPVVFSSLEHNVLRGSYCDRSSSARPSSVRVRPSICPSVNNFFKNLLLQNQKANLDKTWQECSLGEALQKLLKEFNSNKNSGCHGNKMAENGKNL